jgi:hypothetical protein
MKRLVITALAFLFLSVHTLSGGEQWWNAYFTHPGRSSGVTEKTPQEGLTDVIKKSPFLFFRGLLRYGLAAGGPCPD